MIEYEILSYGGDAGYEMLTKDINGRVGAGWHLVGNMCTSMCVGNDKRLILIFSQMMGIDEAKERG